MPALSLEALPVLPPEQEEACASVASLPEVALPDAEQVRFGLARARGDWFQAVPEAPQV